MRRPHGRTWQGAPAPDAAILCALLQRNQNAPIVERRCATHTPGSAEWTHRVACHGRRATSPICSNLSFRHTQVPADKRKALADWSRGVLGTNRYWRWKSRSLGGRPKIGADLRALIRQMSVDIWYRERRRGSKHITGSLLCVPIHF